MSLALLNSASVRYLCARAKALPAPVLLCEIAVGKVLVSGSLMPLSMNLLHARGPPVAARPQDDPREKPGVRRSQTASAPSN